METTPLVIEEEGNDSASAASGWLVLILRRQRRTAPAIFDGSYFTPGKETGAKLRAWLSGELGNGNGEEQPTVPQPPDPLCLQSPSRI